MAGQAYRASRDRGHRCRSGSPLALAAGAAADDPGFEATTTMASPGQAAKPAQIPSPRVVWRLLQMRGMAPDEAANLTAFMHGLPTTDLQWTLAELNQLLFLRHMCLSGRFGDDDEGVAPH